MTSKSKCFILILLPFIWLLLATVYTNFSMSHAYNGLCEWLGEYARDCNKTEFLSHETRKIVLPIVGINILVYPIYIIWLYLLIKQIKNVFNIRENTHNS